MLKLFGRAAVVSLLFAITLSVHADEIQDANKLFKQGQYAQAMAKVDAFLAINPKDAQARFLKGLILSEQKQVAEAIAVFTGLTEDYPERPEPYNNLAFLYAGQGKYEKAKSALEMAIRTNPNYATAHENLGDIYAKMASLAYEHALQLDNSNAGAKAKLAQINKLLNKNDTVPKPAATPQTGPAAAAIPAVTAPMVTPAAPAKPGDAAAADPAAEALKATNDWAAAWAAKDSGKYLSFYAKEFKAPGGDRSAWESQRKASIAAAQSIQVEIRAATTKVADDKHVTVTFTQTVRTAQSKRVSSKTLEWVKADGQWLIADERTGK